MEFLREPDALPRLVERFGRAFREDPVAAFREWFHLQEALRDAATPDADRVARGLSDALWELAPSLAFASGLDRARFFHNLAAFLGTAGPAADLARALEAFEVPLTTWTWDEEPDDVARALHNRANALQNLGRTAGDLRAAVAGYDEALAWRSEARPEARGVTLHSRGAALRRLAELDPDGAAGHLEESERSLRAAVDLRERGGLREGLALSLFHLGLTLRACAAYAADGENARYAAWARTAFEEAARRYESLGKAAEAGVAASAAAKC